MSNHLEIWREGDLIYSLEAAFDAGQLGHPQKVMAEFGITWSDAEPQPMAVQWKFLGCRSPNGEDIGLPEYIQPIKNKG